MAGLLIFAIWLLLPLRSPLISKDYSQVIKAKDGEILSAALNENEQWCFPVKEGADVPKKLEDAVLYFEDQYFRRHPGVNPVSVFRAIRQNMRKGGVVSGASTLTMQVARMHFVNRRTYFNKIREMLFALKIEIHFSKDEILSTYVNHAPYGCNIIGYQAASLRYFKKEPIDLSWSEAATLAVLPNAPGLISPGRNNEALVAKRNFLLQKLKNNGVFNELTLKAAIAEPVPTQVFPFTTTAPHLSARIRNEFPNVDLVETSIDIRLQRYLEFVCNNYQYRLKQVGINNLCALVVDNETGLVRSYIGSADFNDAVNNGQVDGIQAPRSSGSVLKPFLYALSIDDGLISQKALIKDIPTFYDGFAPSNADHKFRGIVPADEALIRSLNIPAVRLLNSYGVYSFYHFMKRAGVSTLFRSSEDYGLTLILGGAEVSPWDVASFYRGLALKGDFQPISFLKKDSINQSNVPNRLISKGASYLILDALKELNRPGEEQFWRQYVGSRSIAWKTGTSYGNKDAWAAGITPSHTVVVWTGNFTGHGNVELAGAAIAGPLMLELFNYIEKEEGGWFVQNQRDFKTLQLCRETGFLAGPNCTNKVYAKLPINMKPLKTCPFHVRYQVNKNETKTECSLCWTEGHHPKSYLVYPPEVVYQLNKQGNYLNAVPAHNIDCAGFHPEKSMNFIYPKDSSQIWLPMDFNNKRQKIVFKLAHNQPEELVYWYLDDVYLGTTQTSHQQVLDVSEGWHTMLVDGQYGARTSTTFQVARSR